MFHSNFKVLHMFIGIKSFLLTKSSTSLSNLWLECLKLFSLKFLTKLSNEELERLGTINKNYQENLLPAKLKLLHFSDPFGMTDPFGIRLLKSNLPSSCIILYGPYFFKLWNTMWILQFRRTLILQSLCAVPLYYKWRENDILL